MLFSFKRILALPNLQIVYTFIKVLKHTQIYITPFIITLTWYSMLCKRIAHVSFKLATKPDKNRC